MPRNRNDRSHGKQPRKRQQPGLPARPTQSAADPELIQKLRSGLRSPEPLDLLNTASGLMAVTDPRRRSLITGEAPRLSLSQLVESLAGTRFAETTAVLTVMRALTADQELADRIGRELATRRHPMPSWLTTLDQARIDPDVWFLTHILGDGDDYLIGVTLPSGHQLSALIYVDHNLGTVVKDAFVAPAPLEDLMLRLGSQLHDPDQSLTRTDPATARAVVEAAIDLGSRTYPPLETDTWPISRPLIEWMLRMLPTGGTAPGWREWSEEEKSEIADDFFASPYGVPLDRPDERSLLDALLWFGTGYATGDPFRWSIVTVELLLVDWFPRKVIAEPAYLAKLPNLARAFIRYAHHREGIRDDLTLDALAAVDQFEPGYLQAVGDDYAHELAYYELEARAELMEDLRNAAGGQAALDSLDVLPLPDEEFDWTGIADDIRPVVQEMLEACDRCADELFDVEHRTAMRRFLARAAVGDPAPFRRRASPVRGAAAIAWVIGQANQSIGPWPGPKVQDLLAWFGVSGSVSSRANPYLKAIGINPAEQYGAISLRSPDFLVAKFRVAMISARDRWAAI